MRDNFFSFQASKRDSLLTRSILLDSCLDDEELAFLGAPWDEYVKTAGEVGLDVLR